MAPSHYLNQWRLVYWRMYASLGPNELSGNESCICVYVVWREAWKYLFRSLPDITWDKFIATCDATSRRLWLRKWFGTQKKYLNSNTIEVLISILLDEMLSITEKPNGYKFASFRFGCRVIISGWGALILRRESPSVVTTKTPWATNDEWRSSGCGIKINTILHPICAKINMTATSHTEIYRAYFSINTC